MKLILGDNQFFGVNHFDLAKARQTQQLFSNKTKISEFIEESMSLGLDGFMINSNETGFQLISEFNFADHPNIECHYSIPYPHKYASIVNESGMMALLTLILKNIRPQDYINVTKFLLTSNAIHLIPTIIRLETPKNLPKGSVVYLQNVVLDLILGLKNGDKIINTFIETVEKMGYKPGIITLNPGYFRIKLEKLAKQRELYLCFNINKTGFNVFPSLKSVQKEIINLRKRTNWKLVGMSVFSSGSSKVSIQESTDFITNIDLDYVIFGTSKLSNVSSNMKLLSKQNT